MDNMYHHSDFFLKKGGIQDEHLDNTFRNKQQIVMYQVAYASTVRALGSFLAAAHACGCDIPGVPEPPRWTGGNKNGFWVSGAQNVPCTLDNPNYDSPALLDMSNNNAQACPSSIALPSRATPEAAVTPQIGGVPPP